MVARLDHHGGSTFEVRWSAEIRVRSLFGSALFNEATHDSHHQIMQKDCDNPVKGYADSADYADNEEHYGTDYTVYTDAETKKWLCDEVQYLRWRVGELENVLKSLELQGKVGLLPRIFYLEGRLRVLEGDTHDDQAQSSEGSPAHSMTQKLRDGLLCRKRRR